MQNFINKKVLVTTQGWFYGKDGRPGNCRSAPRFWRHDKSKGVNQAEGNRRIAAISLLAAVRL